MTFYKKILLTIYHIDNASNRRNYRVNIVKELINENVDNKLIIIGNGLDLNLGLKSRFIDFIYSPQYKSIDVNYDIYNYED